MVLRISQSLLILAFVAGCAPVDGDDEPSALGDAHPPDGASPDGLVADMAWQPDMSWPADASVPPDAAPPPATCAVDEALLAQVDRVRMLTDLETLVGFGERSSWENQKRAADYIVAELEALDGVEVVEHTYDWAGRSWVNVEATFRGSESPDRYVLAGAHFDSTSPDEGVAPGADDDASGVAALLEIARVMSSCQPAESVRLLFFSNEEEGTVGSTEYAGDLAQVVSTDQVEGYINLDMIGYGPEDEDLDIATRPEHEAFAEAVVEAVEQWTELEVVLHIDEHCG